MNNFEYIFRLALLWYHTIVRPFYAVDGHNICAGAEAANLLILETKDDFTNSSIFLFFKGRIHRLKVNWFILIAL